jgi:uncharacterized protein
MNGPSLRSELLRLIEIVSADSSVERVILFGSAAQLENTHPDSDIDICIVQNTELRFYDRLANWLDRIQPKIGLDLIVYTPDEFAAMRENNFFVREEIDSKGREVYAA